MTQSRRFRGPILSCVITIILLFLINSYFVITYMASLNKSHLDWPKGTFRFNTLTAYEMSPSFSATMPDGKSSIHTHRLGYRIPKFLNNSSIEMGGILSIGCSFTYGDGIETEQTFTYLVGDILHLPSYNFGVCSYSYANVILQLRELKRRGILDELKPTILILGAGNWFVRRSLSPFLPAGDNNILLSSYIGRRDERIQILRPPKIFSSKCIYALYENNYLVGNVGNKEFRLNFKRFCLMFRIMPRILYAKFLRKVYSIRSDINSFELYNFVIAEIENIILPYRMKFIILWMPEEEKDLLDDGLKKSIEKHSNIIFVNGLDAILKYRVESKEYEFTHPQPKAHEAYAKEIVSKIRNSAD